MKKTHKAVALKVSERVTLLGLLPQSGTLEQMRAIVEAQRALAVTPDEAKASGARIAQRLDGRQQVIYEDDFTTDIELPDVATWAIGVALAELDKRGKLLAEHVPLWDRFVVEDEVSE